MSAIEDAAVAIRASFLDLAGQRAAAEVWAGRCCHRCTRHLLIAVGLAVGMGPAEVARGAVLGFEQAMRDIAEAYFSMMPDDPPEESAS